MSLLPSWICSHSCIYTECRVLRAQFQRLTPWQSQWHRWESQEQKEINPSYKTGSEDKSPFYYTLKCNIHFSGIEENNCLYKYYPFSDMAFVEFILALSYERSADLLESCIHHTTLDPRESCVHQTNRDLLESCNYHPAPVRTSDVLAADLPLIMSKQYDYCRCFTNM